MFLRFSVSVCVLFFFLHFLFCFVFFNRDLNRGCLVYTFSLRFSGRKFLINSRWQFRVRKIFFKTATLYTSPVFAGFTAFSFCV